ncbi:hypothetical protein N9917_00190 [Deltaproteobacteria bacterium]|nr:hypothetical protein [Deltaproteobacteria bacterium]
MAESEPVPCMAKWNDEQCTEEGSERFMVSKLPFSLAGAQMKLLAKRYEFCDECWPKARPYLMQSLGYSEDEVRKAADDAGLTVMEASDG